MAGSLWPTGYGGYDPFWAHGGRTFPQSAAEVLDLHNREIMSDQLLTTRYGYRENAMNAQQQNNAAQGQSGLLGLLDGGGSLAGLFSGQSQKSEGNDLYNLLMALSQQQGVGQSASNLFSGIEV